MKLQLSDAEHQQLAAEIVSLTSLGAIELKERWKSLWGNSPPRKASRDFMRHGIAYRLQERVYGGLKPATRKLLHQVAEDTRARRAIDTTQIRVPKRGTVLIREWNGTSHRVTVLDDGVSYRGKRHRSLSEVARVITGSRWSGPLFFGLKRRRKENCNGTE
jgi:hypothetical protein